MTLSITLRDLMEDAQAWGHVQGELTAVAVRSRIEADKPLIVRLSLSHVERIDVSFAREIVRLAASLRSVCGVCLTDVNDEDLLLNWDAAALVQGQPLFAWNGEQHCLLGKTPSTGLREMLSHVLSTGSTSTNDAAEALHLKIQNASNKLASLWRSGYLLRLERCASSGGIEHDYLRIA